MKQYLPSEIIINILSRLPVRSIVISRCVCKSWLNLLTTDEFVNSHLSKSVPSLAIFIPERESNYLNVFEFDEVCHDRCYNPLTKFASPRRLEIVGAADGLLLLHSHSCTQTLYICNPITREHVKLCCSIEEFISSYHRSQPTYGFGVSRISRQHKVVQIIPNSFSGGQCHVYTLETGLWTRFEASAEFTYYDTICGACVNGNLHWMKESISCLDLQTECFSIFSAPPLEETGCNRMICALKDYLCVCYIPSEDEIVVHIWLMKEYGVEKSWTKEYVTGIHPNFVKNVDGYIFPIKVFKDGDILMLLDDPGLFYYYSSKTQTYQEIGMFKSRHGYVDSMLFTPSFLSLKSLGMENVISF